MASVTQWKEAEQFQNPQHLGAHTQLLLTGQGGRARHVHLGSWSCPAKPGSSAWLLSGCFRLFSWLESCFQFAEHGTEEWFVFLSPFLRLPSSIFLALDPPRCTGQGGCILGGGLSVGAQSSSLTGSWGFFYGQTTLLKSHGMQLGHQPCGSLTGEW